MKISELKTEQGRVERCNADMAELQISSGKSLTADERQVYAIAWRDGCKAALEHAQTELLAAIPKKNTVADFRTGQRVAYVDFDGSRDYGVVSSVGAVSVFVKFDRTVAKLGWDDTTSQSCNPKDLVDATEPKKEAQPPFKDLIL